MDKPYLIYYTMNSERNLFVNITDLISSPVWLTLQWPGVAIIATPCRKSQISFHQCLQLSPNSLTFPEMHINMKCIHIIFSM